MSAVAGLLSVATADPNDLVGEYQQSILVRNAKGMNAGTTLFGLMSRLRNEPAENNVFNWFERDPVLRQFEADAAVATAIAAPDAGPENVDIVIDDSAATPVSAHPYLVAGMILRNDRTGEYMRVAATPTSSTVSCVRAVNTTADTSTTVFGSYTIQAGDVFTLITLGKDEGADPVRASYEQPSILTNYIQTFNSTVNITNAFKANKLRTDLEGPLKDRRIQALEKIAKDIEMAYLFGYPKNTAGTNGTQWFTGGIKAAVDTGAAANALDGGGASGVALDDFLTWMQGFMTVGSDAKLGLCGPTAYSVFSNFANQASNGFRIMNQETVFGMNVTVINTPFGELSLAFHPLLKEIPVYKDWMFVVDLAHVVQKVMEPLFLEPNIQTPGSDSYKEQYRAKLGLKLKFAEAFGYASDLQKVV